MIIEKDRKIKIIFKNGVIIEGIVDIWNPTSGDFFINSMDDDGFYNIPNLNDVMVIKVFNKSLSFTKADHIHSNISSNNTLQENTNTPEVNETKLEDNFNQIEEKIGEIYDQPRHDIEDIKKLADLRKELAKSEKQAIANKLKSHLIKNPKGVQYGHGLFKK